MVDIATLGFSIDSSQAGSAATNLDRLTQAATNAERSSARLEAANTQMGRALAQLVQGQNQQIQLMEKMVEAQTKMSERTAASTRTVAELARGMDAAAKSVGGLTNAYGTYTTAVDKAYAATKRLLDLDKDNVGGSIGGLKKEFEGLQRVTGATTADIISIGAAVKKMGQDADDSAVAFNKISNVLADTSEATKTYRSRIEDYIGSIKGLSSGEVVAKLTVALNQTQDSAQKTADALQLLGVRGAEGLEKLAKAGVTDYSHTVKEIGRLNEEALNRTEGLIKETMNRLKKANQDIFGYSLTRPGLYGVDKGVSVDDPSVTNKLRAQITGQMEDVRTNWGTSQISWAEDYRRALVDLGEVSEETAAKLKIIYADADRVRYEGRQSGGFIGFFRRIIADLRATSQLNEDMEKLRVGTYSPGSRTLLGVKLEDFDPFAGSSANLRRAAPASAADVKAGQQLVAQYDGMEAAAQKYNEVQRVANELFQKGAISADALANILNNAGAAYTRATAAANPYIESLRKEDQARVAAAASRTAALRQLQAEIDAVRMAAKELGDTSVLTEAEIERLRGAQAKAVQPKLTQLVDRQKVQEDIDFYESKVDELDRYLRQMSADAALARPSEALRAQTDVLQQQIAEAGIMEKALEKSGVAGEEAAKRTISIFQEIKKEMGSFAAGEFLLDEQIPARMKDWVQAFDELSAATKRLQAQRAVASEERDLEKINAQIEAYKKGPEAIAKNEQAMKLLAVANTLGFDSFQKLAEVMPTVANRLQVVTSAAAGAKVVLEAMKSSAEAARTAAAASDIANLGPTAPTIIERERARQELDRKLKDRLDQIDPYDMGSRIAVYSEWQKERDSTFQKMDADARSGMNASAFQQQLQNDIARAQRSVATAGSAAQGQMAARVAFVQQQMMPDVRTPEALARAREVLAGKTNVLDEAERRLLETYREGARINRAAELDKYQKSLDDAATAARALAQAEGAGPAWVRYAQAQNRIKQAEPDQREMQRAAEVEQELIAISRIVGKFEGQLTAAQNQTDAYFQMMAEGATTVEELALQQEIYNAALDIGHDITRDTAEMEAARTEALKASEKAIKDKVLAEGMNLSIQQQLKASYDLENLTAYNTALAAGGDALGKHLDKVERNSIALTNFKTKYADLSPEQQKVIDKLVETNAAMEANRTLTQAINALKSDKDNLEYLQAEVRLIGASRREREVTLATMRLQQEEQRELNTLIGREGEDVEKRRAKIQEIYSERRAMVGQTVDAQMRKQDLQQEAQVWQDIWKNAFAGIQSAFSSFFSDILNGGIDTWDKLADSLKRVMFQVIAQITAAMVFRPLVGNALNAVGASYDFMSSVGLGSFSSGAPAGVTTGSSGFSMPGFGGGDMMNRMLGPGFSNWYNTPWFQVGGTAGVSAGVNTGAYQSAANAFWDVPGTASVAGATPSFTFGPSNVLPVAGAGLSIFNAIQNPNIGTIAGAGASTAGAIMSMIPSMAGFGPWGMIAGAVLSLLGNTIFKQKPSNKGAEYSFNLDEEFSTQFEGTKHPDQMAFVKSFADPLQDLIVDMERRFGVSRRGDATIGANFGIKEGSSFFYDAGPRDGDIENRKVFKFDPEDEASIDAALNQLTVAFLKDADWTGIGQRIGTRAATDVATALENSAADTIEELMADVDFAAQFSTLVDIGTGALTPLEAAFSRIEQQGAAAGQQLVTQIEDFYTRAQDLGLGVEMMSNGFTGAQNATRGFIDGLFELPMALDPIASTTAMVTAQFEVLTPTLLQFGYTAEQINTLLQQQIALATQAIRQAQINAQVNMESMLGSALDPNYRMPADTLLYNAVGYKFDIGPGGGTFSPLAGAINRAAAGDASALQEVYDRLQANIGKKATGIGGVEYQVMTQQEAAAIFSTVSQWFTAKDPARQQTGSSGISNGGGSGGGSGSTQDTSEQQRALREQITALNNNSRELSNWANQFGRMGTALLDFRKSLLLGPLTPLTPFEQYQEANRQFEDALARSRSSDKETAIKGMDDLRTASQNLLEKSRNYWASSDRYQQDFDKVQRELLSVGNAAKSIEQQQLDQLKVIEQQLKDANESLEALTNRSPSGGQNGVITTPGGGTTPSSGYPSNQYPYANQGVLFGVQGMGRSVTENAETFMKRRFDAALYSGPYDETSAYNWLQQAHPSGFGTRNQYYAAATKAGFTGKFGGTGNAHLNFLNADKTGNEWRDFILELRKYTTVNPGHFKAQMATDLPEWIYTFNKGGVVGQFGNVVPFPTRQGMIARQPTLMRLMGGMAVAGEQRDEAVLPLTRTSSGDMGVVSVNDNSSAVEMRRMIAQQAAGLTATHDLLRSVVNRLDELTETVRRRAA